MKRSNQILSIVFLLVLLGSSIFAVSATEYSVSEQSITWFDETLLDDVRYYPDGDLVSETIVASAGSSTGEHPVGSYVSTQAVGGDIYSNDDYSDPHVTAVYLNFTTPYVSGSITVSFYATYLYQDTTADVNEIGVWDGASWDDFGDISNDQFSPYDETWVNFTITSNYIIDETISIRGYLENDDNIFIKVDYAEVSIISPIVLSSGAYAESFADESDWIVVSGETPTSDGDVMSVDHVGDSATKLIYSNAPSLPSAFYYMEYRYRENVTATNTLDIVVFAEDDYSGASLRPAGFQSVSITWKTHRVYFTQAVESIRIGHHSVDACALEFDYLRIFPANESGYQDDCSTVAYTTALRVDVESDGDHIQFQYSGGGGTGELSFHTDIGGSNIAAIDTNYYPFIGWNVVNLTDDYYEVYADNTLVYTGTGLGLQHVNVKASGEDEYTTITFVLHTVTESMALDWVKGYSIANYTVTQGLCETDDYLFVEDNILYSSGIVGLNEFIRCTYDITLSINGSIYNVFNVTTNLDDEGFYFTWYNAGSNIETETTGSVSGTIIGFYIQADAKDGDVGIRSFSAIKFIDTHKWREVGEAELIFIVPLDETGLDMLLIFLGLFMIPASTLYLVRGGRSGMSMDKLFFGLIAFVIGWALFIGGIM